MKGERFVGRKNCSWSRAFQAVAPFVGAMMLPVSALAQFGPTPSFGAPTDLTAQTQPQGVAVANFNAGTALDLAVINFGSDSVSVFLGNGAGGFTLAGNFPVGVGPVGVAAGDVNGDGNVDIVTANSGSNVTVLLGNGLGGFAEAPLSPFAAGSICQGIAIGEVTGNTFVDLVVANFNSDTISVLSGDGAGNFALPVDYAVGNEPIGIALAHLNADSRLDVIVTNLNGYSNGSISVLLGNAGGTLTPVAPGPIPTGGPGARSVAVGHLDGDGFVDVVVANPGPTNEPGVTGNIAVLLGNGNGTFEAAVNYVAGDEPLGIAVGDFNSDGQTDVAVSIYVDDGVRILTGNGAGLLQTTGGTFFPTGDRPVAVGVGDFNGDVLADLAVANISTPAVPNAKVSVLLNTLNTPAFQADLSVSKTDGVATETPGTAVTYTITVSNAGPDALSQLTLTDTLPAALLSPVFTPTTGTYNSGNGAWTGITLPMNGTVTMTVSGTIHPAATADLVNSVTVATIGADTDPVPGNNSASDTDTLFRLAELTVTKTDGVGVTTETPGTAVSYTITVSNAGPSTLTQLTLIDTLPGALQTPVFTPTTGTYNSGTGAWTGISLAPGGTVTMTVSGTISPTATGDLVNSVAVAVTGPDTETNTGNNTASDTDTLVRLADLSVTKTDGVGVTTETPGTAVSYTITVSNAGPSTLTQLTLIETLPAALQTPVFTPTTGTYNSGTGAWTGISLAPGGTVTMTLSGTISPTATGNLVNSVAVAVIGPDTETNTANNTASDTDTLVPSADVAIAKTGPAAVAPGQNVTYTILVTNNGPSDAAAVSVADITPAGLTFVSNAGDCTTTFPCSLGAMSLNQTKTITTTFAIGAGYALPTLANTATVSATTSDPVSANNSSTASSTVSTSANLAVTKTGPAAATKGEDLTYTITVTNNGPADATTVQVTDVTPTGLTFVSNSGDCVTTFPCSLGLVAAGATRTITATFSVPANYAGPDPIENTASVSSATTDPVSSDNTATASTSLVGQAFHTVTPCRVIDTRDPANAPALGPGPARTFAIAGACNVPSTAQAVSINVTATQPTDQGDVRVFPAGGATPGTSTINYGAGQTRANNAVVKLGTSGGLAVVTGQASGTVHFILDVNGYFE